MMKKYNMNQTTLKIFSLYRNDYARRCYVREIAREIGVDLKAVQIQLKRVEAANVLSSTKRGRITEYRLNLENILTKYFMILAEAFFSLQFLAQNFLIKKALNQIGDRIDKPIILFGSFAKGQTTKQSDIDLLVLTERRVGTESVADASDLVGRKISIKSASKEDFLRGLQENDPLVREVVSSHVLLRGVDDFCNIMWRYYARQ